MLKPSTGLEDSVLILDSSTNYFIFYAKVFSASLNLPHSIVMTDRKRTEPLNMASIELKWISEHVPNQMRKRFGPEQGGQLPGALRTEGVIRFVEWKFLNHAVDFLVLRERDRLFRIVGMTTRPGLHRDSVLQLNPRVSNGHFLYICRSQVGGMEDSGEREWGQIPLHRCSQ